jgi:Trk K+ transport system NAD-binding subunit
MVLTPIAVMLGKKVSEYSANKSWQKELKQQGSKDSREASVIIIGMGEVGQRVADGLNSYGISYRGIEVDHECFMGACTKGYLVGFGDATDLRLMDTIQFAHAQTIVITFVDYTIAKELAPIVKKRYPNLSLMISVKNNTEKTLFSSLDMLAVIDNSFPRGLDMAVMVLEKYNIDTAQQRKWMLRQQENELITE